MFVRQITCQVTSSYSHSLTLTLSDTDSSSAGETNTRKGQHHQRPPLVNPKDGSVVSNSVSATKSESALEEQVLFVVETTPSSTTEGAASEQDSQAEAMECDPVLSVLHTTDVKVSSLSLSLSLLCAGACSCACYRVHTLILMYFTECSQ